MSPPPPPVEPVLRLRPLGLGEILDDIFRVYRRHFGLLVGIALLLSLPGLAAQLASGQADQIGFLATFFGSLRAPAALAGQPPPPQLNLTLLGVGYLLQVVLVPFTVGAISRAAIDLALGGPGTIRSALLGVLRRYWALLGLSALIVLIALAIVIGVPLLAWLATGSVVVGVLLVLAGMVVLLWLAVRWAVCVPALLAERIGPVQSLRRSWQLTRRSWWRLFGILVIMTLLQGAVGGALGVVALPFAFLLPFAPPVVRGATALTLSTLSQAVTLPVLYLCFVLLYFDLRIRREDFDLDQLARQAVGPAV